MIVGIVAANNIRFSPYIHTYVRLLEESNIDYELIIPNRNDIHDNFKGVVHELPWKGSRSGIINYYLYTRNVKRIINNKKYDYIIVLTTVMSVFLDKFLKNNYRYRYLIDCRDYTYENNKIYYWLEKEALSNSDVNIISSPYFKEFLPAEKFHVLHNINISDKHKSGILEKTNGKIKISYIGSIAYYNNCVSLINLVKSDPRFEFHIHGDGPAAKKIKDLVNSLNEPRIVYHGGYLPDTKTKIIDSADILFNTYGNESLMVKTALSNKLYESLFYKKPILVNYDTAMLEAAGKIAFPIDYNITTNLDSLYEWYRNLDAEIVSKDAEDLFDKYVKETIETERVIKNKLERNASL